MKKYLLAIAFLINSFALFAQDEEVPEYGKIDKIDLELKACSFDKDASAYKLLSLGDVSYKVSGGTFVVVNDRRTRIKILNDSGLSKAKVKIIFYSKAGSKAIKSIVGNTYNFDNAGNIVTSALKNDSIKYNKISNKLAEVSFNMPDVKAGSVFEYEIVYVEKSIANIDDWYFQDDIPTRFSMYSLTVPYMFKFETQAFAFQEIDQSNDIVNQNATYRKNKLEYASASKDYILRNVPALKKEPYMTAEKDYLERISFRLSQVEYGNGEKEDVQSDWSKITSELLIDPDFGLQLNKKLSRTKKLDEQLTNIQGDYNKMITIHDYVRSNIKWNGDESLYTSKGIDYAWGKKTGNAAEINFVLLVLLRDAGLKAYPIIASTNDNGSVNTQYPLLRQFNITMACVDIDGTKYILNAANKYTPAYIIPANVLDNDAFVVDKEKGGWIKLNNANSTSRNDVIVTAQLTPDSLTGNATIKSFGYSKIQQLKRLKDDKDTLQTYYTKAYKSLKIDSTGFTNLNLDSAHLEQQFGFSMPATSSGTSKSFSLNLFQGLNENPLTDETRMVDIDFVNKQSYTIYGEITIPENYQFAQIPKDLKLNMPDSGITFTRFIKTGKNLITFRLTLEYLKTLYDVKDYPEIKDFYKKLYDALKEEVIVKRSKQ